MSRFKKKQENTKTPKSEATPLNDPHRVSHRTLHHIYITLRPVTAADMEGRDAVITQWERTVTHLHPAAAFTYNGRVAVIPPAGAGRPCPLLSSALSPAGFITRQGSLRCSPGVCLVIVRASRLWLLAAVASLWLGWVCVCVWMSLRRKVANARALVLVTHGSVQLARALTRS